MGYLLCYRKLHHLFGLIAVILLLNLIPLSNGHSDHHHQHQHNHDSNSHHDHHHHHHDDEINEIDENPSFKYSRQANEKIIPDQFKNDEHDDHHQHASGPSVKPSTSEPTISKTLPNIKRPVSEVWLSALGSTAVISIIPFLILWFIPLDNSAEYQPFLKILLSFASGSLLGDAFLHLIPHALMAEQSSNGHNHGHSHGHGHNHGHGHSHGDSEHPHEHDMFVGLWVLGGILAFLIVEKFVRICKGPGHGHSHSYHGEDVKSIKKAKKNVEEDKDVILQGNDDDDKEEKKPVKTSLKESPKANQTKQRKVSKDSTNSSPEDSPSGKRVRFTGVDKILPLHSDPAPPTDIKVAGYLNLAADFAHNLTDGLAIGASFISGQGIGFVTTLTILFHEIPHEIGDFAILVQSGCSRRKAMFLQLLTAIGALTGTLISLVADGMSETASPWILPFTAGGFIYIACVSVIPDLLEDTSFKQSVLEILAAALGVGIMVFIAQIE